MAKKKTARKTRRSKTARKKAPAAKSAKHKKGTNRRWVRKVTTESTFPPEGTFKKDAQSIAKTMASKRVSPKGIGSGIKMIQYFINRGGKGLPATQKKELEKAKRILQRKTAKR
jgi:hypothetical protein